MPNFDTHFYKSSIFIVILSFLLYILGNFFLPLYGKLTVSLIEHFQSLFLLFMCGYSYNFIIKARNIGEKISPPANPSTK
ncbi:hypothetical protein GASC598P17_000040, partial [Gilliamella apis SCGC AB-598-P17]